MNKRLFLFGAGQLAKKYTELLEQLSVNIDGYIDNNSKKWGTFFLEKKVFAPEMLKRIKEIEIIIACSDVKTISEQLKGMGLTDKIISIDHAIRIALERKEIIEEYKKDNTIQNYRKRTIIVDNINGTWGGAEDWAHRIYQSLLSRGYNVELIENINATMEEKFERSIKYIDKRTNGFYEIYMELISWLWLRRPFTLFNVWSMELLWAASYLKKLYPEEIQIISSILNDNSSTYQCQCEWNSYIDLYLCISSKIKSNLIDLYGIDKEKVFYKEPFIVKSERIKRNYQISKMDPLRICYPCRLVCQQKRADMLPELIDHLEKNRTNYVLNIAGEGEYEKEIIKYIEKRNLQDRVKMYGKLSQKGLGEFLYNQDVYLNISEFEGTSLTMLEAMVRGCVPVVTDVSGVRDFIENIRNGFISDIGDIKDIAKNIMFLDNNREILKEFGMKCTDIVMRKCNLEGYIDYIENLIDK